MTNNNYARGRKFEQTTHSGHASLAAVGGITGNPAGTPCPAGSRQSETRTDDLLSGCATEHQRSGSFQKDNHADELDKNLGHHTGNKQ